MGAVAHEPGGQQDGQVRARLAGAARQDQAADAARHDHVCEQQVDARLDVGAAGACLFFGFFSSLQIALQRANVPAQLLEMLPYLLTIVAIAGFIGRTRPPAADGIPFERT